MASLVVKALFSLTSIITEPVYYLNSVSARYDYVNGKRTDKLLGYTYTVTNIDTFDQIHVFVEQEKPLITTDKLHECQASGKKIYVEFTNATIKPYYSDRTHSIEDSIKAVSIQLVETD